MRVLFVSVRPPLPRYGGAALRGHNFIRCLADRHEIHLVCCGTVREELEVRGSLGGLCETMQVVPRQDGRGRWKRVLDVAASPLPDLACRYPAPRLYWAVEQAGHRLRPDLVHVLGLEAAPAAFGQDGPAIPQAKTVLDDLNAEYLLQQRAFQVDRKETRRLPVAGYSLVQSLKLRHYEQYVGSFADGVIASSEDDEHALRRLFGPVLIGVVPNGVDTEYYRPGRAGLALGQTLLFTGSLDFRPNVDAVTWFAKNLFPDVRFVIPEAQLVIAGRDPVPEVQRLAGDHVTVTGPIPEDLPFFREASLFVLPMRYGGGSRLKLLQALACGLPVVSTRLGASGYEVTHERHALLADTPGLFFDHTVRLLTDRELARALAEHGRALALQYDWRRLAPRLERFYEQVLEGPSAAAATPGMDASRSAP